MEAMTLVAAALGGLALGSAGGFALAQRRRAATSASRTPVARASVELQLDPARRLSAADDAAGAPCQVPGCASRARLRGLCRKHYGKAYRLGLLETLGTDDLRRLAEDRRKLPKRPVVLRMVEPL